MPNPETCPTCLRPRYTAADLERWKREFPDGNSHKDPPWARKLCWTMRGAPCGCRPGLEAGL